MKLAEDDHCADGDYMMDSDEKEMMVKKAEVSARWDISLNCDCPKCGEFVDLLLADNFWDDHERLQPIESGTERSNSVEVICPQCSHEFDVCCEY